MRRDTTPLAPSVFPADAVGNRPAFHYGTPQDVLHDPTLSQSEKRDVLQCWALVAYRAELVPSNDAKPHISKLDDIIDALVALDEPELHRFITRASGTASASPMAA